jgi:hypothetical protein
VLIAHQIGMQAPIDERLAILARQAAAAGAKPGDIRVEELADYVSDGRRIMRFSAQATNEADFASFCAHSRHCAEKRGRSHPNLAPFVALCGETQAFQATS